MPTQGNDIIYWNPLDGNANINGLGDQFDSNLYQPYDLAVGVTTGDLLRIEGNTGGRIDFTSWNSGSVKIGASTATFINVERVYGSGGNDVVRAKDITVSGPDGHGISIFSGAGHDSIVGSNFADLLDGGAGNDTIYAGAGDDFVNASPGNDLIYGGAGNDNIRWGVGSTFDLDPGNDTIYGGDGNDLINVWVTVGNAWGQKVEGASVEILRVFEDSSMNLDAYVKSASGISKLYAQRFELGWTHEGDDTVSGANANNISDAGFHWNTRWGDDILIGSNGNDTLEGGDGADTITGGAGDDLISGTNDFYRMDAPADAEVDTFIFRSGHGHDTVLAFGDNDILDLGGRQYSTSVTSQGTLLTFNDHDSILLSNVFDF